MTNEVIVLIRVGVIGYGTIGQIHSKALASMPGCALTVVADLDADRKAQAQRDFGVAVVHDLEEMLQRFDVDLVDICVPTYLHEQLITVAIQANKHIFCEEPLARSLKEGQRLLDLSANYQQKIGIGHVVRFTPAYLGMRESVMSGEIGDVGVVRSFRGGAQFPTGWQDWFSDYELSGGVILDLAIHDLDFLRWLFGDVKRVYAKTTYGRTSAHLEHALIVLRFSSGVIAHVEGSWTNIPGEFYTTMELAGKNGLIRYDSRKASPIMAQSLTHAQVGPVAVNPYRLELEDMVEAIREDRAPRVSVSDAFGSLEVALAAIESARTGQVVELEGGDYRGR